MASRARKSSSKAQMAPDLRASGSKADDLLSQPLELPYLFTDMAGTFKMTIFYPLKGLVVGRVYPLSLNSGPKVA
jgi:hypothetical protein